MRPRSAASDPADRPVYLTLGLVLSSMVGQSIEHLAEEQASHESSKWGDGPRATNGRAEAWLAQWDRYATNPTTDRPADRGLASWEGL